MPVINLEINTDDIYSQFDISSEQVEQMLDTIVKEMTAAFAGYWEEEAKQHLHGTRERYLANLKIIDEGRMKGAVVLDYTKDPIVPMIEEGADGFDMKEGFAKSDKRKPAYRKDSTTGWYLTIPLRHTVPGSTGEMGSVMPKPIYQAAKQLEQKKGLNLKTSEVADKYKAPQTRHAFSSLPTSSTFEEYQHKFSKYQGIVKIKDNVTGQSSYLSFRRVSDQSDANSFIHPGIDQRDLGGKAKIKHDQSLEVELTRAVDNALISLGF